ncbi:MAG: hypothetical protein J6J67_03745 [Treponema sp.]|nr:hypothetical protein [Treponema sp.]
MLKKILKKQNEKVAAFTLIETLVSLLVVSLMGMILYFSFFVSVKSVNSSNNNVSVQIERLNTDRKLRTSIESVRVPFWVKEYDYSFSKNQLLLSWINGIDKKQNIGFSENVVLDSCIPILSKEDRIIGFEIKYSIKSNQFTTKALFSSYSYGEKEC